MMREGEAGDRDRRVPRRLVLCTPDLHGERAPTTRDTLWLKSANPWY